MCSVPKDGEVFKIRMLSPLGIEKARKSLPIHLKVALLGACSVAGTLVAVFVAVNIPSSGSRCISVRSLSWVCRPWYQPANRLP